MNLHHHVSAASKLVRAVAIAAFAMCSTITALDLLAADICETIEAWRTTVRGKSERKRKLVEAKETALHNLAKRAWYRAIYSDRDVRYRHIAGDSEYFSNWIASEDRMIIESARIRYRVDETLKGGSYEEKGDRHAMSVTYCVEGSIFERARQNMRNERQEQLTSLHGRIAALERMIAGGRLREASNLFPGLKADVNSLLMDFEEYTSVMTGQRQSLGAWLMQWSEQVRHAGQYAAYCVERANEQVMAGHLAKADHFRREALEADPYFLHAHALGERVTALRADREEILQMARHLAAEGRFGAAHRALEGAERVDADDQFSLATVRSDIATIRAEYNFHNPRLTWGLFFGFGSLGFDGTATEERINAATGLDVGGDEPLTIGLGLARRLGRHLQFSSTAGLGYGRVSDDNKSTVPDGTLFDLAQVALGIDFRTVQTADRATSFELGGGVAWESVDVNIDPGSERSTSDSEAGFYIRAALRWRIASIFLVRGIGFEHGSNADSLVAWSDGLQFGAALVF
jgi:hypothetical protein